MTQVSQIMSRGVRALAPDETVMKAAQAMQELDVGVIPVCDGRKLVGMVTDRDIVLRGVARGCIVDQAQLKDVMSTDTQWCFEDQSLEEVSEKMRDAQIRRVPVIDHDKQLVGMLSLGDIATRTRTEAETGETLEEVSKRRH
ncbi:MAG: CBS domain-containing protein [Gemmatimonadales bacterium]|nr:CBS domain-containing protein [Gemmatimonadales bacterium]